MKIMKSIQYLFANNVMIVMVNKSICLLWLIMILLICGLIIRHVRIFDDRSSISLLISSY